MASYSPYGYEQNIPEATSPYSYDRPLSPNGHSYPSDGYLQNLYEINTNYPPSSCGPHHSFPMASSGFMLLSQPSGFIPSPSGFFPLSRMPIRINYNSQFYPQSHPQFRQIYTPLSNTSIPANNVSLAIYFAFFHPQQPFSASQSFSYPLYNIPPSASAPTQQFLSSPPPASFVSQAHPYVYIMKVKEDLEGITVVYSSIILRLTGRHLINVRLPRLSTSGRGQI